MNNTKRAAERLAKVARVAGKVGTVILGIVILIIVIAWLSGAFQEKVAPHRVDMSDVPLGSDLRTDVVHEVEKEYVEEAIGTLKAASRTVISSKVLATIQEISVTAGDSVEAGDVLVKLDDQEFQARLRQAEQTLEAARATREDAETDLQRNERLFQQNAVAQAALDDARRHAQVAKAEELRAQQAVEEAKVMLGYTVIRAPKAGRVVDRLAEPGDTAQPGQPLLVLYDATSLRLEAPVPEHLAVQLKVGQEFPVYIDALDREFPSTVDEIVPQADAASRSFLVKARLPQSDDFYEGMVGRLRIPAGTRRHLCLATAAIVRIGQLEFVDVVGDDGTIERRLIKTGRLGFPGRIEVLSGLEAGERVVLHEVPDASRSSDSDQNAESSP